MFEKQKKRKKKLLGVTYALNSGLTIRIICRSVPSFIINIT